MGLYFRIYLWGSFLLGTVLFLGSAIESMNWWTILGSLLFLAAEIAAVVYLEFMRERDHDGDGPTLRAVRASPPRPGRLPGDD